MKLKRIVYFGYYIKTLDYKKFIKFLNYQSNKSNKAKILVVLDIIYSTYKYNISILDYFYFKFTEKNENERSSWAGTGYMYEYQLKMNPKSSREILNNKCLFYRSYKYYFKHLIADIQDLKSNPKILKGIINNPSGKIVFKVADGKCGTQVLIKEALEFREEDIIPFMQANGYNLIEEYIIQHQSLNMLSPSGVNTVRIFTQVENGKVVLLGCRLRISVNKKVDNLAAGNIAASIDEQTGIVNGVGIYSDITEADVTVHPITGIQILNFKLPYWEETIEMVKTIALLHPQNLSVGWDIAITDNGPDLIEGNHDWCKLVYQLPVKKGLKKELERFEKSF